MTILFRLSSIGDRLPLEHLYPTGHGEHVRRPGAQCFSNFDQLVAVVHGSNMGGLLDGSDRLLIIRTDSSLPTDESGWSILTSEADFEVRSLTLPTERKARIDALFAFDDDADMWAAAQPVAAEWTRTV